MRIAAIIERHREEIAAAAAKYGAARLSVFGSAADGSFVEGRSDIDFAVKFQELDPAAHADAYFGLLSALEDLLNCRIDLLEEEAIRNPYLRSSIDHSKQTLYAA